MQHWPDPKKWIAIIRAKYEYLKCFVLLRGKIFEEFEVHIGGQEGFTLYPILFLLTIGEVLHAVFSWGWGELQSTMTSLLQILRWQHLLNQIYGFWPKGSSLGNEASRVGLKVNINKTKVLSQRACIASFLPLLILKDFAQNLKSQQ